MPLLIHSQSWRHWLCRKMYDCSCPAVTRVCPLIISGGTNRYHYRCRYRIFNRPVGLLALGPRGTTSSMIPHFFPANSPPGLLHASPVPTLHPSIFSPPVPCSCTFWARVPCRGLRARVMGSRAGLRALPQPSHCWASGVAGAVMVGASLLSPNCPHPCP